MKKHVDLLWTGGWDSTFRLCQLSRMSGIEVQPFYIKHPKRLSMDLEIRAMTKIQNVLRCKRETAANILPVHFVDISSISIPPACTEAFKRLRKHIPNLGSQYEWLAAFARYYPDIELGEEHYYQRPGTLGQIIWNNGIYFDEDGIGHLPRENIDSDIQLIFGNYSFPIISLKEVEMKDIILKWRYKDVMRHIWFCQHPIDGKPCGVCTPCQIKMKSGMEWLLPQKAQKANNLYKYLEKKDENLALRFKFYLFDELERIIDELNRFQCFVRDSSSIQKQKSDLLSEISYFQSLEVKFL